MKHKDKDILKKSSSGGVFTALSDCILSENGYIFGAIYDEKDDRVKHIGTNDKKIRDKMRGSKYIQSDLGDCFKVIEELLRSQKLVLFTGTMCQVTALYRFLSILKVDTRNLYCCDVICHGVGSPKLWTSYIDFKRRLYASKVTAVNFRNKERGWKDTRLVANFDEKEVELPEFMKLYYGHTIMRESCYQCPYANLERSSDITIGDFWGVEKIFPSIENREGVSFVLVNTSKGETLIDNVKRFGLVNFLKCEISDVVQPNFYHATKKSVLTDRIWKEFSNKGIEYILCEYTSKNMYVKIKVKIKKVIEGIKINLRI